MFYNEEKTIKMCEEDPSLIFELMREGHFEFVEELLDKQVVDINTLDESSNDVITRLLRAKQYHLVLKYMKKKTWDVNHQNIDGNTFAHYLVSIHYVQVLEIIKELKKNRKFKPNIKNKKDETILDKSINENYIYTTLKILEDKRFHNIDVTSFQKLVKTYIKNPAYGRHSKLDNLTFIVNTLEEKDKLLPNVKSLVDEISDNMEIIKTDILKNKFRRLEGLINEFV